MGESNLESRPWAEKKTNFAKENILFLLNPKAGQGKTVHLLDVIVPALAYDGALLSTYFTQSAGEIEQIVSEAGDEYDRIIVSGGDGSLHELLNGYMRLQEKLLPNDKEMLELGYIPTGTTCDFAKNLTYPSQIEDICACVRFGQRRPLDAGLFNETRNFVYVASFGAFADSSYQTPTELKNSFGKFAYFANAIKNKPQFPKIHAKLIIDGEEWEEDLLFLSCSNSVQMGGLIRFNEEEIRLNDGYFELIALRYPSKISDLSTILHALMQADFSHPLFLYKKVQSLQIELDTEQGITLDGENAGRHKSIKIEVIKDAWHLCR